MFKQFEDAAGLISKEAENYAQQILANEKETESKRAFPPNRSRKLIKFKPIGK